MHPAPPLDPDSTRPMEALERSALPSGEGWQYEPKWDGFRCLAFRSGNTVALQSKAGQPLGRYFPELVQELLSLNVRRFVLDGEIAIFLNGRLSFDDLLMRIHPAESRIRRLSTETPATLVVFDLLVDERGHSLVPLRLDVRRQRLEQLFNGLGKTPGLRLSPASRDRAVALRWMKELAGSGFDGVIAKRLDVSYASGNRTGMVKVKRIKTADCVVGGFRYASKGGQIGSLLLGLYNDQGQLDHIGFTSSFNAEHRKALKKVVEPLRGGTGFTGKAPGGPSRWSTERSGQWEALDPKLVCEVSYDYFSQGRFRHGTKFLRWRPDKAPKQCTMDQVNTTGRRSKSVLEKLAS